MRIITGTARGRRLAVPPGREVRPTSDRVREALFSTLGGRVVAARVLDLFAGSGAFGLEALSRGAARAVFVERSRRVLPVLGGNIAACGFAPASVEVLSGDALAALDRLATAGAVFDLVFVDPPYDSPLAAEVLARLTAADLLVADATIVVEHRTGRTPELPAQLLPGDARVYGETSLLYLSLDPSGARGGVRP